jgi:LL-diaminopimelate aminotransferase
MYIWAKVPTEQSSFDFTIDLLNGTGVVVTPGRAFGEGFIRISLVQPREVDRSGGKNKRMVKIIL